MSRKGNNPAILPFDVEDPDSLYHMVPMSVQAAMQDINPLWFSWTEQTVIRKFEITARDMRLRLGFWDEYFTAKDQGRKMMMSRVYNGACSRRFWEDSILKSPKKLSFIMTMPGDYMKSMKALHYMAVARLEEIIKFPLRSKGKPNLLVADRVMKAFSLIDNRVKGLAVQRMQVEQKNMNVNINKDMNNIPSNPEDLAKEIADLEKKLSKEALPAMKTTRSSTILENSSGSQGVPEAINNQESD